MNIDLRPDRAQPAPAWWDHYILEFPARPVPVVVAADSDGVLVGLRFGDPADHAAWIGSAGRDPGPFGPVESQLRSYAAGEPGGFDLAMRLAGTEFQLQVWQELLSIPYGATSSYGAVAAAIGRHGHARAVGAAVGANPIGIIVPCHRVLGAQGALTGFAGGLDNKTALLALEGITAF